MDEYTQYIFFFTSWISSFVLGLFVLGRYWKNDTLYIAGIYIIKPFFVYVIAMVMPLSIFSEYSQYYHHVVIEVITSLMLIWISWKALKDNGKIPWLIVGLDAIKTGLLFLHSPSSHYEIFLEFFYYGFPIFLTLCALIYQIIKTKPYPV